MAVTPATLSLWYQLYKSITRQWLLAIPAVRIRKGSGFFLAQISLIEYDYNNITSIIFIQRNL